MTEPLCPACKKDSLTLFVSCCMDPECCGLSHEIKCNSCHASKEIWDDDELAEEWLKLGGTLKDIENAR